MNDGLKLDEMGEVTEIETNYFIRAKPGLDYLVVIAGVSAVASSADFTHPNISGKVRKIHEFKRYYRGGGKKWFSKPGVDFYFCIPKSAILIKKEKGYSFIKAQINGVDVSFNVSGGTSGDGWCDYLSDYVNISVGHCKRDLMKLAEVAIQSAWVEIPTEENIEIWESLIAKAIIKGNKKIRQAVENTENATIVLSEGFSLGGNKTGTLHSVSFRKGQYLVRAPCSNLYRVRSNQINWTETAKKNGLGQLISA